MPRIHCRFVFGIFTLLIALPFSKTFNINSLPATVTVGQEATITWTRSQGDPNGFQFAKTMSGKQIVGLITSVKVEGNELQGSVVATFLDAGTQVTIAAWKNDDLGKKPPFFLDTNHPISIVSTIAQAPPTQSPTTPTQPSPSNTQTTHSNSGGAGTFSQVGQSGSAVTGGTITSNTATQTSSSNANSSSVPNTSKPTNAPSSGSGNSSRSVLVVITNGTKTTLTSTFAASGIPADSIPGSGGNPTPAGSLDGSQSHSPQLGLIVGVILGVLAFIILLLLIVCVRHRTKRDRSIPSRIEAFYREKMVKSAERVPPRPQPDLEPLNKRLSVISEVTTTHYTDNVTFDTSKGPSSDWATIRAPGAPTIRTITESESTVDSLSTIDTSDFASTIEPGEDFCGNAPRTDRQMDIEKRIFQLQEQLVNSLDRTRNESTDSVPSIPRSIGEIRDRIKRLRELQDGAWARELIDEPPVEIL